MTDVWIVQPYIPKYRVPFFEELATRLALSGVTMSVVAGQPRGAQASRGDAVSPEWLVMARDRTLTVAGRSLALTSTYRFWRQAEAVIVPHMGSSLDAYQALARGRGRRRVGVWGHVASYVKAAHPLDAALERWQLRQADHVFAYTPSGARYAIETGVPSARVTAVMNAVDTTGLVADFDRISTEEIREFRARHGIPEGPVFAYLGGLDGEKRVGFLAATLDELAHVSPDVHLVVGGDGNQRQLLSRARERGQVTMLGFVEGREKALLLKVAQAIVNPGRIGLLAVEAIAVSRPILSATYRYHAPEFEYLEERNTLWVSADDPKEYAALIVRASATRAVAVSRSSSYPTLEGMVSNFAHGVMAMLEAGSR